MLDLPRTDGAGPMDQFFLFPLLSRNISRSIPVFQDFDEAFLKFTTTSPRAFWGRAGLGSRRVRRCKSDGMTAAQNQIANCTNECTLTPGVYYLRITPAQGHSPQGYNITAKHPRTARRYHSSMAVTDASAPVPIAAISSPGQSASFSGALYAASRARCADRRSGNDVAGFAYSVFRRSPDPIFFDQHPGWARATDSVSGPGWECALSGARCYCLPFGRQYPPAAWYRIIRSR